MSKMTNNDYELLEMAMETTYASSIRSYIEEADTEECRKQLKKKTCRQRAYHGIKSERL